LLLFQARGKPGQACGKWPVTAEQSCDAGAHARCINRP
jgi:hypothetical protein